jgi:hypothetical protein
MSFDKQQNLTGNELSAIAEEFPYYPIARFKLLSHCKKNNDRDFEKHASITALFFSNTNWLNRQLHYQNKIEDHNHQTPEINNSAAIIPEEIHSSIVEDVPHQSMQNNFAKTEIEDGELNVFEPLHTVDYFASQGIKVSEEPINNDKLTTQLKSFTEWLKSMKKLHTQLPEGDEQTDKIIQHIAETSNTHTNIVTEAMAEVLVKQDKLEQAIEMYEKLSLNYPAKSAYFAAKIKSLKPV